ncbi:chymotrypsin B-like [Culicoides brevitarsis]|uniref:chymotrypsin B-like n=1 Tax=Culicoides brevitarsis TaxID=469753 RepID=UPI00307B10B3
MLFMRKIISETYALSLASCLEFKYPEQITLLAGATDISSESNGLLAKASKFIFHPDFDFETNAFDIVVIEVRTPFIGKNINPVKLSTQGMPMYEGLHAEIAGWGNNQDPSSENILHKVSLPIVDLEKCSEAWNRQIPETAICAGQVGYDTCSSDNGGALVYCGLQIGINIKNSESCDGAKPAVFTNISHPGIRSFIRQQTGV